MISVAERSDDHHQLPQISLPGSDVHYISFYSVLSFSFHSGPWWLAGLGLSTFDGNSGGNLWSVPSATWVNMPSFKLNASISCQHPHIIHRSYSSLHVWWSAFLTWWFVEWRCGQVPWIRLCLWWVEMSKLILCIWVVLAYTSVLLSFAFSPFWCMMVDWNWALYHSGAWWWTGTGLSTFWWELCKKSVECAFCNVSWHSNFYVDC